MWAAFAGLVGLVLYIDLAVLNKRSHVVSLKEASAWCSAWVALALLFCAWIWQRMGPDKALEFLTGYVIEYSLSVDNMFVFIVIFGYFDVPRRYQPRVLHWGILGAVVMRLILIFAGVQLIHAFHWVIYVFGGLLVATGVKMLLQKDARVEPQNNPVLRLVQRFIPFDGQGHGDSFFVKAAGRWHATPLFATVLVVEASDLVFAVDSIPAILAVTTDPFIVYTSNVFAILGLRSLYFMLSGVMGLFRFLKVGISIILCYVGVKMLLVDLCKVPIAVSLGVVIGILALSILASVLFKEKPAQEGAAFR
ncbi:MAG: TerC family protein [Elusimicrobia bacterium]|nr:TerC family protein [Elusimicrobiota bacterium]